MGNYKFRLSDMMPNAWFYKLKDMGKPRKHSKKTSISPTQPQFTKHRHSYYFTSEPLNNKSSDKLYNSPINPKSSDVHFPDPSRRRRNIKATSSSSVTADCTCRATIDSTPDSSCTSLSPPDTSPDYNILASWSSSCSCRVSSSATEIIIDMNSRQKFDEFDPISRLKLPPIVTKPAKFNDMVSEINKRGNSRRGYVSGKEHKTGLKLRSNSPRIVSKKIQAYSRKSISCTKTTRKNLSDSFAIVKSSFDPQRDFRESMVEMIVENNIRASKDLEELLACYLSLNSNEYHDIIVKVFEQIWFDLTDIQL